jgi:hypothetical protein
MDSFGFFSSSNIFFLVNQYVIDVKNLSQFFSFLTLPLLLQQRASVNPYNRKREGEGGGGGGGWGVVGNNSSGMYLSLGQSLIHNSSRDGRC